jgi:hypothetical protein
MSNGTTVDDEQPTCGKGIAAHSTLPAALGELMAVVAENLEAHMKALDPADRAAAAELDAYRKLAKRHRKSAARLQRFSELMAGYRDLPMAPHHEEVLMGPETRAALEKLVAAEKNALALLQERVAEFERMLAADAPGSLDTTVTDSHGV